MISYEEPMDTAARLVEQIEASSKPLVVMSIGAPASGKSTVMGNAAQLMGEPMRTIDVDAIRNRLVRLRVGAGLLSLLHKEVHNQADFDLMTVGLALIDGKNIETFERKNDIVHYRGHGAAAVGALYMDVDIATAKARNAARSVTVIPRNLDMMHHQLQQNVPTLNEGFDWILSPLVTPD